MSQSDLDKEKEAEKSSANGTSADASNNNDDDLHKSSASTNEKNIDSDADQSDLDRPIAHSAKKTQQSQESKQEDFNKDFDVNKSLSANSSSDSSQDQSSLSSSDIKPKAKPVHSKKFIKKAFNSYGASSGVEKLFPGFDGRPRLIRSSNKQWGYIADSKPEDVKKVRVANVQMSARKARLVVDMVRNKPISEAAIILAHSQKKAALVVSKLLHSAVVSMDFDPNFFYVISKAYVNEGKTLKRLRYRAQGRGSRVNKRSCTIVLEIAPAYFKLSFG